MADEKISVIDSPEMFVSATVPAVLDDSGFICVIYGPSVLEEYDKIYGSEHHLITNANIADLKALFDSYIYELEVIDTNKVRIVDKSYLLVSEMEMDELAYTFVIDIIDTNELSTIPDADIVPFTINKISEIYPLDFNFDNFMYVPGMGILDLRDDSNDTINKKLLKYVTDKPLTIDAIMKGIQIYCNNESIVIAKSFLLKIKEALADISISKQEQNYYLDQILMVNYPEKLYIMKYLGLFKIICPEFDALFDITTNNNFEMTDLGLAALNTMRNVIKNKTARLAALFLDTGKAVAETETVLGVQFFKNFEKESIRILSKYVDEQSDLYKTASKLIYVANKYIKPTKTSLIEFIVENNINSEEMFRLYSSLRVSMLKSQNVVKVETAITDNRTVYDAFLGLSRRAWTIFDINIDDEDILEVLEDPKQLIWAKNIARSVVLKYPQFNYKEYLLYSITNSKALNIKPDKKQTLNDISLAQEEKIPPENADKEKRNNLLDKISSMDSKEIDKIIVKYQRRENVTKEEEKLYNEWLSLFAQFEQVDNILVEQGELSQKEMKLGKLIKRQIKNIKKSISNMIMPSKYLFETDTIIFEILYNQANI